MKLVIAAALAATVSSKCYKDIKFAYFTDDECKTPKTNGKEGDEKKDITTTVTENDAKVMNEECNELDATELKKVKETTLSKTKDDKEAGFLKVTCDTKAIKSEVFAKDDDKKCKGTAIATLKIEWAKCTKIAETPDVLYATVTGASSLAATAAAALAMVASQF